MADIKKTIEIIFAADDKASGKINALGTTMEGLGNLAAPIADLTKKILAVETAILGLAGAAAVSVADFQSEIIKINSSLGLVGEDAEKVNDVFKNVFQTGIPESMEDASNAVQEAYRRFGETADLESISTTALKINDAFGLDLTESLSGVQTLMKNFGLTADESFNFIISGLQKGLNGSDDFIDSINEYATQFKNGGADAGQFFSILETGFQGGMLGTDRAADAFKEFRVRVQDGSDATFNALESIGVSADYFIKQMANGSLSTVDAFNVVIKKLNETDDQNKQFQAGVGLLGTQFEDLGTAAALALSTTKTSMEDLSGSTKQFNESFGNVSKSFKSLFNTIKTEVAELDIWDELFESASENIDKIKEALPKALEGIDLSELLSEFEELGTTVLDIFDFDLTTADGLQEAIQNVIDTIISVQNVVTGVVDGLAPFFSLIGNGISYFNSMDETTQELIGTLGGLTVGITGLYAVFAPFVTALSGGVGAAAAFGVAIGTLLNKLEIVRDITQGLIAELDQIFEFTDSKTAEELAVIDSNFQKAKVQAEETRLKLVQMSQAGEDINVKVDIEGTEETEKKIESVEEKAKNIDGEQIDIKTQAEIKIDADTKAAESTLKNNLIVPFEKTEIKADLKTDSAEKEIEELKFNAQNLDKYFEYKAEVDVAQIEAESKNIENSFNAINQTISSAGSLIADLYGAMADADISRKIDIENQIDDEFDMRKESFELQKRLTETQIKAIEARQKLYDSGKAIIEVKSEGLKPALEMIWQETLEYTQVQATADGMDLLLGI